MHNTRRHYLLPLCTALLLTSSGVLTANLVADDTYTSTYSNDSFDTFDTFDDADVFPMPTDTVEEPDPAGQADEPATGSAAGTETPPEDTSDETTSDSTQTDDTSEPDTAPSPWTHSTSDYIDQWQTSSDYGTGFQPSTWPVNNNDSAPSGTVTSIAELKDEIATLQTELTAAKQQVAELTTENQQLRLRLGDTTHAAAGVADDSEGCGWLLSMFGFCS